MKDGLPDLQQGRHGLLLIDPYNDFISPVFLCAASPYRPGDYETWKHIARVQKAAWSPKAFEYGTSGLPVPI
jgi:hypothetical protein